MPSPVSLFIYKNAASALGLTCEATTPTEAVRQVCEKVLNSGRDPRLPVRISLGGGAFVAHLPSLQEGRRKSVVQRISHQLSGAQGRSSPTPVEPVVAPVVISTKARTRRGSRGGAGRFARAA